MFPCSVATTVYGPLHHILGQVKTEPYGKQSNHVTKSGKKEEQSSPGGNWCWGWGLVRMARSSDSTQTFLREGRRLKSPLGDVIWNREHWFQNQDNQDSPLISEVKHYKKLCISLDHNLSSFGTGFIVVSPPLILIFMNRVQRYSVLNFFGVGGQVSYRNQNMCGC